MNAARLTLETLRLNGGVDVERQRSCWTSADTRPLAKLVEVEGCELWLWRKLSELGVGRSGSSPFLDWLDRRARATVAHNLLVDAQADRVAQLLCAHGVPFVLIKGTARRALVKEMPFADARVVSDVDVLVPSAYAYDAWEHLRAAGYQRIRPVRDPAPFHLPPVFDRDRVLVELHTSTSRTVAPDEAWHRAVVGSRPITRAGVTFHVQASTTELLWHAVTHALNHYPSSFRLRLLLDAAVICAAGLDVDWKEIERRLDSSEVDKPGYAVRWLSAAAWLAGTSLPEEIARRAPPFDLGLALSVRMAILRRIRLNRALCPMLMDGVARAVIATRPTLVRRRRKVRVR
jgi:Uncharacterised nucleotidyltransferase